MIQLLIERASSYAASIDNLFLLILVFVGFWFLAAEAMFFWLIFRFREKPGVRTEYLSGGEKHVMKWITIPHFIIIGCDIVIVAASFMVWNNIKIDLPPPESTVRVIGQQWAWIFQHPGTDNQLDTADDIFTIDDLYVERDRVYHFQLESRDVLHNFSVPVFRLKQDAIPGRRITGWFEANQAGSYDIQCAEICGIGHGVMFGRIHVQDALAHREWILANTPVQADPTVQVASLEIIDAGVGSGASQ